MELKEYFFDPRQFFDPCQNFMDTHHLHHSRQKFMYLRHPRHPRQHFKNPRHSGQNLTHAPHEPTQHTPPTLFSRLPKTDL